MGIRLHLCCDDHFIEGYRHHDPKIDGWRFEMGLPYEDVTVECITISHGMSQMPVYQWPAICAEFHRVLCRGGIVRITDDDCENPESKRYSQPWPGVRSLTGPKMTEFFLWQAGFAPYVCDANSTRFKDTSICIALRIAIPTYVYYVEAIKP